jgi:hypothetical protein
MIDLSQRPSVKSLRAIGLLSSFSDSELESILSLGRMMAFEDHTNIIIEGEFSGGLFIITEGIVGVFKTNSLNGQNYDVGHLRAGAVFGEMSLIDENPRSATVRALTQVAVYSIPREEFKSFISSSGELEHKFLSNCVKVLASIVRDLNDKYVISQYQLWESALKRGEQAS